MEMESKRFYDRSRWPSGPWDDEPDRVDWVYAGLRCLMLRNALGAWCGYVMVPEGHPWHGKGYAEIEDAELFDCLDQPVHGGLTFGGKLDGQWAVGFDCAHAGDIMPTIPLGGQYCTMDYVISQVQSLADAVHAVAPKGLPSGDGAASDS